MSVFFIVPFGYTFDVFSCFITSGLTSPMYSPSFLYKLAIDVVQKSALPFFFSFGFVILSEKGYSEKGENNA